MNVYGRNKESKGWSYVLFISLYNQWEFFRLANARIRKMHLHTHMRACEFIGKLSKNLQFLVMWFKTYLSILMEPFESLNFNSEF